MPLRNRATPLGELVADPARGPRTATAVACTTRAARSAAASTAGRIACRLRFRGWQRSPLLQPGRFTELFFLDEATAFAAGHRPCALCRREDYVRFGVLWSDSTRVPTEPTPSTPAFTVSASPRARERSCATPAQLADLPDGAFVRRGPHALDRAGRERLRWTPGGYAERRPRPASEPVSLLTPPSLVSVLARGWEGVVPLLHPSAERPG